MRLVAIQGADPLVGKLLTGAPHRFALIMRRNRCYTGALKCRDPGTEEENREMPVNSRGLIARGACVVLWVSGAVDEWCCG
jgi:hypothetical protein